VRFVDLRLASVEFSTLKGFRPPATSAARQSRAALTRPRQRGL